MMHAQMYWCITFILVTCRSIRYSNWKLTDILQHQFRDTHISQTSLATHSCMWIQIGVSVKSHTTCMSCLLKWFYRLPYLNSHACDIKDVCEIWMPTKLAFPTLGVKASHCLRSIIHTCAVCKTSVGSACLYLIGNTTFSIGLKFSPTLTSMPSRAFTVWERVHNRCCNKEKLKNEDRINVVAIFDRNSCYC